MSWPRRFCLLVTIVTMLHRGHSDELYDCMIMLVAWAEVRGLKWDSIKKDDGEHFAARLEFYRTDPAVERDAWETEIRIKLDENSLS
jgi:hypothetical protein